MITRPQLPPKTGYVEVEVDGVRTYKNATTGTLIENELQEPSTETDKLKADIDILASKLVDSKLLSREEYADITGKTCTSRT